VPKNVDESRLFSEMEAANRKIFKRAGFRYILHRAEQSGNFTGLGATPYQSVRLAPFEDVVASISLENSLMD